MHAKLIPAFIDHLFITCEGCTRGVLSGMVNLRCGSTLVGFRFILLLWIACQTRSASSLVVNESVLNSFSALSKSNLGLSSSILHELEESGSSKRDCNPLAPIKYRSIVICSNRSNTHQYRQDQTVETQGGFLLLWLSLIHI